MQGLAQTDGRQQRRENVERFDREYTFTDMLEVCAFMQAEIVASKRSYKWIAERAEVCAATVSNLASGTTHFPRAWTIFSILKVLDFEVVLRK